MDCPRVPLSGSGNLTLSITRTDETGHRSRLSGCTGFSAPFKRSVLFPCTIRLAATGQHVSSVVSPRCLRRQFGSVSVRVYTRVVTKQEHLIPFCFTYLIHADSTSIVIVVIVLMSSVNNKIEASCLRPKIKRGNCATLHL